MKKYKLLIIILLFITLSSLIPIIVSANVNKLKLTQIVAPAVKWESNEEYEQKGKEEKEHWIDDVRNGKITPNQATESVEDITLTEKFAELEKAQKAEEEKLVEIINRFYPKEFVDIQAQMKQEFDEMEQKGNITIPKATVRMFELITNIIETKKISNDEKEFLKNLITEQYDNIDENQNSLIKAEVKKIIEK